MQIKTLDNIKAYTSKMEYRGGTEKYHDKISTCTFVSL